PSAKSNTLPPLLALSSRRCRRRTTCVKDLKHMSSYGWGPQDLTAPKARALREVAADPGLVLEDAQSGWVGAVVRVEKSGGVHLVSLEDRRGKVRSFPLGFGFLFEG